jgi:Pentapeptide repeats (9 copies)
MLVSNALAKTGHDTIPASRLAKQLALGRTVTVAPGTFIRGRLDLRNVGVVRAGFECRRCQFEGGIIASQVVFQRAIDISGSYIVGPLNLARATFLGPLQFGREIRRPAVWGVADFTGASFADLVDAREITFRKRARFELARFREDALFVNADFRRDSNFAGVSFEGRTRFDYSHFRGETLFSRSFFNGDADFRFSDFDDECYVNDSEFRGRASFAHVNFYGFTTFELTRFGQDATFTFANFRRGPTGGPLVPLALALRGVVAQQTLDLESATFSRSVDANDIVARTLNLDLVHFGPGAYLFLDNRTVHELRLSLDAADREPDDGVRQELLALIEDSAKRRDDLSLANDAHYRLQKLRAKDHDLVRRAADAIFYRTIAGYFVRPLRPLLSLVLAIVLFATWRSVRRSQRTERRPVFAVATRSFVVPQSRRSSRFRKWSRRFEDEIARGVVAAVRWRSRRPPELSGLEITIYRLLLICIVLSFSTDPQFRELLDFIR